MLVSVVICTHNRATRLSAAITSVLEQDAALPYEIVVVDNDSTDDTRAVVVGGRELARPGPARARDGGVHGGLGRARGNPHAHREAPPRGPVGAQGAPLRSLPRKGGPPLRAGGRLRRRWFARRYFWQG